MRFLLFRTNIFHSSHDENLAGLEYSRDSLRHYRPLNRVRSLLYLAAATPDAVTRPILIIGPRYMNEYWLAVALGWKSKDVYLIDLIPSSSRIRRGDMHSLPFTDDSFFTIICGWTISYSRNPALAASEMTRCLVQGGGLIIGVEFSHKPSSPTLPDILSGSDRIQTPKQFLQLFPELCLSAYLNFRHIDGNIVAVLQKLDQPNKAILTGIA
jgi:SAM-dependent methyltransferase